jgi:hypothetical protein
MQIFAPSVQYVAKHRHVVGQRRQSAFMRWWSGPAGAYLIDHIQRSLLVARSETRRKTRLRKLGWLSEQFAQRPLSTRSLPSELLTAACRQSAAGLSNAPTIHIFVLNIDRRNRC